MSTEAHESDDDARPGPGGSDRDGAVEPYVFDAELVDDDEPAAGDDGGDPGDEVERPRPLIVARERTVAVITTLGGTGPVAATGRGARRALRASWTAGQGLASWADRLWLGATHGRIRRQVRTAELEGNREALAEWTDRLRAERDARVQRLLALPGEVLAALQVACLVAIALGALLFALGVGAWIAPDGMTWSSWWGGVGAVLLALGQLIYWLALAALVVGPAALALAAWREGERAATPPMWLLTPAEREQTGIEIDERAIALALANLGISVLAKFFKDSGQLTYVKSPRTDGDGMYAQVRLPLGVTVEDINKRRKRLAANLQRAALEVWATTDEEYDDEGLMDLWVADKGALRTGAGPWPLLHDGFVNAFDGVPIGRSQRGAEIRAPVFEQNWLVGGRPGQGKSAALRTLCLGCALDLTAELWAFVMGESPDFAPFAPRLSRYAMGMGDEVAKAALQALRDLLAEMERRGRLLSTLPGGPPKTSRKLADRPELGLHLILCVIDEVHELFMHEQYGAEARKKAVKLIKRGRKYGIVLVLATQSPTDDSLPRDVTRNVSIGVAFAVSDHIANDGLLGQGRYKAGIRATELRPTVDRGTAMTVGITENTFELIKWFYVPLEDGHDEVTPVIERAVAAIGELRRTGPGGPAPVAALDAPVDHLADILDALRGEARVRTTVVLSRLAEANPREYEGWSSRQLSAALLAHGVPVRKLGGGQRVVCLDDVRKAVSERDAEPHDDLP